MIGDAAEHRLEVPSAEWQDCNQRYLLAALTRVQRRIEAATREPQRDLPPEDSDEKSVAMPAPAALEELCTHFSLTQFERDVLLLCAGVELDASFAACCANAHGGRRPYATFSLALAVLEHADWGAIAPTAALRQFGLIEVLEKESLTDSRLRIDERILHYLAGINYLDEHLASLLVPIPAVAARPLPQTQEALVARVAQLFSTATREDGIWPLVQIYGTDASACQAVCAASCADLGLALYSLRAVDVPASASERDRLRRLWTREVMMGTGALLISIEDSDPPESLRNAVTFCDRLPGIVLLSGRAPLPHTNQRLLQRFELARPGILEHSEQVSDSCRLTARVRLEDLAQRIEPVSDWSDLVLPAPQLETLHEIAMQRRHQSTVYARWGFAKKSARGLGITALFAGGSGTGKTLAAEVLSRELGLDLYRIDLSQVVNKYIGETEKNLRRVFDAAEEGGAILLFDEADALFGKRSEVKDSHDRHANIEVSYLLQRMETYQGLSILTSNLKSNLDPAFLRRLRFIIQFPFPDIEQRREIWQRAFPSGTPVEDIVPAKLARLNVAGGHIRNIALNAAFLAAAAGEPVRMPHLLRAVRSECIKLEKPLTEAEIGGWV